MSKIKKTTDCVYHRQHIAAGYPTVSTQQYGTARWITASGSTVLHKRVQNTFEIMRQEGKLGWDNLHNRDHHSLGSEQGVVRVVR
jgi:hypothetical protein